MYNVSPQRLFFSKTLPGPTEAVGVSFENRVISIVGTLIERFPAAKKYEEHEAGSRARFRAEF
jgi:hypothetical protein